MSQSPIPYSCAQSDATIYEPPLDGIIVSAPGTLTIKNELGNSVAIVFPAVADGGGSYPYTMKIRIRQVMDTGTDIANANLTLLKR